MAYDLVNIVNSTDYEVYGKVIYATLFCSNDNYWLGPYGPWTARHRGWCLVTEISASVYTPGGPVKATSYISSSGSTYSKFAVIQISANPLAFEVTRRVSSGITGVAEEDGPPEDYEEPTTQQKD
jgi:hypothetical protein